MDFVHVRERLAAFAGRFRRAANPEVRPRPGSDRVHETPSGLDPMHTFGAGRR